MEDRDPDPRGVEPGRAGDVVALVLAAGSAKRFGATKQLVDLDGRPLVRHAVDVALTAGITRVLVVTGHDAQRVTDAVAGVGGVETVHNPLYASGQSTSLVAGLDAAERAGAGTVVVLLADQPGIAPAVVEHVVNASAATGVARARYSDGPGHPVAIERRHWPAVRARVSGDEGARRLLEHLEVVEVTVDRPAPVDVDTPDDVADVGREPGGL